MKNKYSKQYFEQVKPIVSQCDKCGSCLTVCPLFGARDIESSSARGKNNLARAMIEGVIKPTEEVLDAVNFCLLCRTCVDNCPSKVKTDEAMIAIRQYFADNKGGPEIKYRLLGGLMKSRNLVKFSAGTIKLLRKVGINSLVPHGMAPREFTRSQYLASFAGPAALGGETPASQLKVTAKSKTAYFRGCGMNMMFPNAVEATLNILRANAEPEIVNNVCCGLPHLAHGLRKDFLDLTKENIAIFEKSEVIVTDCASCSGTLKHAATYFDDDRVWRERAAAFSRKVMGLSEYLHNVGYTTQNKAGVTLTFHEPCHLGRGQGIKHQPRELLKAAGNYVEMQGANTCCGGAGSFHIDYPEISKAVLDKKRVNIEKSGAQVVVTECPTCLVQLSKAAAESGGKFKAMHISQVL